MKPINATQKTAQERDPEDMAPRWAAILAIAASGVLYLVLPQALIVGPSWLLLVIEAVFLLPIVGSLVVDRGLSHKNIRRLVLVLLGIITLALAISILLLIVTLPKDLHATVLLRSAALLWFLNILVFSLWYWEIDGGGPLKRYQSKHQAADFMFPQQAPGTNDENWAPHYMDYFFLAFTNATALSPADTYPLTRTAKAFMMIEAVLSMTVIVLLAARAINILGG